jgi:hypothetical protein
MSSSRSQQMVENPSTFELSPFLWKELWITPPPPRSLSGIAFVQNLGRRRRATRSTFTTGRLGSTCRKGAQVADLSHKVLGESWRRLARLAGRSNHAAIGESVTAGWAHCSLLGEAIAAGFRAHLPAAAAPSTIARDDVGQIDRVHRLLKQSAKGRATRRTSRGLRAK